MKPHPRIRKMIKWGGAAVTVLLVVVWIGSGWFYLVRASDIAVGCCRGCVVARPNSDGPGSRPTWWVGWHFYRIPGGFEWALSYRGLQDWNVPLWMIVIPVGAATALAWRLDTLARRRAKGGLNLCPKCGYDRTGLLKDAKCPECGAAPASV